MKRICFLFFFLFSLFVHSQTILSDSVLGVNCYHEGSISLSITNVNSLTLNWYYEDEFLVWISIDTMSTVVVNVDKDSLITTQGGSYKLEFNGITKLYWVPPLLGLSASQNNINCFGDSSGMLKRVAYAGSPPYFYEWFKGGIPYSSGYNDTLFDNLAIGLYKVVITDSIGCSDSVSTNVVSPSLLIFDTTFTSDINCRGINSGSVSYSVSGGKQYTVDERYDYFLINLNSSDTVSWVTRDSTSPNISLSFTPYQIIFDSLFAGEYILSVVDSFGCILDDTFEIKEPVPYEATALNYDSLAICESDSGSFRIESIVGDSLLGSDSLSYKFLASNEDTFFTSSGLYQIEIEDLGFNCIDIILVKCKAKYEIKIVATINHVNCFGDSTGEIVIDSIYDGNAPYDVQWGGVDSSALSSGTYEVHIVDAIGCLRMEEYTVTQANQINPNEVLSHPLCYGDTNGSITINILGGVSPYIHSLSGPNGFMSPSLANSGLSPGLYPLYVEDGSGCLDTFNISLLEVDTLVVSAENYQPQLSCTGEFTNVDLLISGGTTPYFILWDDGDTNLNRVVGAGSYTVQVTDVNGCAAQDLLIIITEPDSLSISIDDTAISCTDGGVATAIVSGGVAPLSYLWSNGDTTQTIDSLSASTYWVFVTDSCGNSVSDTVYFDAYELLTEVYYDDATHMAEVEIESTNSAGPFSYEWRNDEGSILGHGIISPALCEDTFFVVTTDVSNDCFVEETFYVEFYLPLGSIVNLDSTSVYPNSDLWGFGPYKYKWEADTDLGNFQDVDPDDERYAKICPGYWLVEVRDINDCPVREYFEIEPLIISFDPESASIKCDVKNLPICITVVPDLGTRPYSFEWWNGDTAKTICSGITPGDLNVTVEDANGCKEDASFEIEKMTSECIPDVFTPDGDGMNDIWNLEDAFLFSDSEIRVYGRYGKLLFEKVAGQAYEPWDGTNEKGNDVPDGVYFYSIEIGHGFDPIKGTVTILRRR